MWKDRNRTKIIKKKNKKIKIDILKQISEHNPIPEKLSYDSFSGIESLKAWDIEN